MDNFSDKFFYHIYPLGMCGAPKQNDFACPAGSGLRSIAEHIPRLAELGVTGVYIGPLFESVSHGYDTVDYFWVDRRLGSNADLKELVKAFHGAGIAVILDAVFNHTSREFFAFKDLRRNRAASQYADWYAGIDFSRNNQFGDGFSYEGWAGHLSLVKLNGDSRGVRDHLLLAVKFWIDEFDIDGLRLDAANVMSVNFMRELSFFSKEYRPGFWLLGEQVAGDYRGLAHEGCLDSVTNYELYKSLWSSFANKNFFELSWTLKREYAGVPGNDTGMYRGIGLYNFTDNHDVDRVAGSLNDRAHLFPLYGLFFCLPGVPAIYYGSEYGAEGKRTKYSDAELRPVWNNEWQSRPGARELFGAIKNFARIRREHPALRRGEYRELLVKHEQFVFMMKDETETIIAAVNAAAKKYEMPKAAIPPGTAWRDALSGDTFTADTKITVDFRWLRILVNAVPV